MQINRLSQLKIGVFILVYTIIGKIVTLSRGGGGAIYDIVRMCGANSPLLQRCQVYDKPPFSKKKYMTDPVFHYCYMNGPIF